METKSVKYLILGGGLSGLSVAFFLKKDYLILEKDSTVGGYCRTIKNDKYVWDYAGHFYHFRQDKYKKMFMDLVEADELVYQNKNTKIFYKDALINYPFQTHIHELPKDEFIDCLYDLYTKNADIEPENFIQMLYAKFGQSITEKFLKPYNEKLYATDLANLDKDAMGRFFPYADFDQIMKSMKQIEQKTYNETFMYLKKGTGYFIDKLAKQLDQDKILTNTECVAVDIENKIATTSSGDKIKYQYLINTAPMNQFLGISNNVKYQEASKQLSYNQVLVLNLGFAGPSKKYQDEHWVYFPDKALNFYRVGFYNNILNTNDLSLYVEIGLQKNQEAPNIDEVLQLTLENLRKVKIIDEDNKLVDYNVLLMNPAYVHITTKDDAMVQDIIAQLGQQQVFCLGRYGCWTYNSMEDCIGLADKLANKLKLD